MFVNIIRVVYDCLFILIKEQQVNSTNPLYELARTSRDLLRIP